MISYRCEDEFSNTEKIKRGKFCRKNDKFRAMWLCGQRSGMKRKIRR